jgi:uncharacterized protein YuzE
MIMQEKPILTYDEEGDILYLSFHPGEKGTGVELNEHILLRFDKKGSKALSLTFFNFSVLVQMTEIGPRSFPLTGLADIPDELREIVLRIITTPPVNRYLKVFAYTPSLVETVPITLVERPSAQAVLS